MRIPGITPYQLKPKIRRSDALSYALRLCMENGVPDPMLYKFNRVRGLEQRRELVSKWDGHCIAVARACDTGDTLAEHLVTTGIPADDLGILNLSCSDIAGLRPHAIEVFETTYRVRDLDDVHFVFKNKNIQSLRGPFPNATDEELADATEHRPGGQMYAKLLDVVMTWYK